MKTNQEIFDIVAKHLLTQNKRSTTINNDGVAVCRYRGDNGLKCAAGVLITDGLYSERMEGFGVFEDRVASALTGSGVCRESLEVLRSLQIVHDDKEPAAWVTELERAARHCGLSFNAEAYGLKADPSAPGVAAD